MKKTLWIPWLWRVPLIAIILFEFTVLVNGVNITPDYTELGLFLTSTILLFGIEIFRSYIPKKYSYRLYWWAVLPGVLSIYLDALGDFAHFYSRFVHYDTLMHTLGAFSATLFIWNLLQAKFREDYTVTVMLLLTFCMSITIASGYEILEFSEDFFTGSSRFGDSFDTGVDLVMDFMGAGFATLLISKLTKHGKTKG